MYFIEGLANGRIAVLGKIHHALADGVASANLMARGMDLQAGPADRDTYATDPAPTRSELVRTAFGDHLRQIGRFPGVVRYTARGISNVRKSSKKLSPELTRPFTPPPSFMNHMVDGTRRFATATLALADVKETAKLLGVTINDMVLAISSGALRQLCLKYDGHADHPLLASVPVSFDFSRDRISGNYFTGVMMVVPIELDDPLERVKAVHDAAAEAKETHNLMGPELVSLWSAYFQRAGAA
jgi:diacylglycerol O-acyltransferase